MTFNFCCTASRLPHCNLIGQIALAADPGGSCRIVYINGRTLCSEYHPENEISHRSIDSFNTDYFEMAQKYNLKLINEGNQPWTFYVYQRKPDVQEANLFSLAWLVSEYALRVGDFIEMTWTVDYNFVWGQTGTLRPGVTFHSGGTKPCNPSENNMTIFSMDPAPGISPAAAEVPKGSLIIHDDSKVPPGKFSVGIGMSGVGTFVQQAGPSLLHHFTPTPAYYVAAGTNVQVGEVLNIQSMTPTAEVKFPTNVYSMTATLGGDNKWTLSQ